MRHPHIKEHTPEWHAIRQQNVGGSESASLFGVQADYGMSRYTLHMVKSGKIPPPIVDQSPGSRVWFGIHKEPSIARNAALLFGWDIVKGTYVTDDTTSGMAASIDFEITEPGEAEKELGFTGPGVLQIKNVNFLVHARSWVNDEPPYHILIQLQHEIACLGYSWGVIAAEIGGDELRAYRYAIRPRTVDAIREKIADFWQSVRDNKPPLTDDTKSTAEALAALFPPVDNELPVDLSDNAEIEEVCNGFLVSAADLRGAKKAHQGWANRLRELMEGRKRAVCSNYQIDGVFTKEIPARPAREGEIISGRSASQYWKVKERTGK